MIFQILRELFMEKHKQEFLMRGQFTLCSRKLSGKDKHQQILTHSVKVMCDA